MAKKSASQVAQEFRERLHRLWGQGPQKPQSQPESSSTGTSSDNPSPSQPPASTEAPDVGEDSS